MNGKHLALLLLGVPLVFASAASCGPDDDNKASGGTGGSSVTGGTGGDAGDASVGGSSGSTGGTGGTGGSAGEAGSPGSVWQAGKVGTAGSVKTIMENGGPVLAIDVLENAEPMMHTMDWDPDSGLPPTIPTVDFSEATPNSVLVMEVPPYLEQGTLAPAYPPYTVYIQPDGTVDAVQHYQDWTNELATQCYGTFPVTVNGVGLQAFGGMVWDVASGLGRNFVTTSADDCVYEVLTDGSMDALACGLEGPSALAMHPMGYLMLTTLPGFTKNLPNSLPAQGVKLYKLIVDSKELSEVATMPVPADYETDQSLCYEFPYTDYALPTTLRNPVAVMSDGSYMVADSGAGRIYKVSTDGSSVDEYAPVSIFVTGLTVAPNDVLYGVFPPMLGDKLDGNGQEIVIGPKLSAWDDGMGEWVEIAELPGYTNLENSMSWANTAIPCPDDMLSQGYKECLVPMGVFMKLVPGETQTNPYLMISDPVTTRIFQVVLNYGTEPDAGAGGSAGSAGSSGAAGSAGASGTAGSAGSAGTSGVSGAAGMAGAAGAGG